MCTYASHLCVIHVSTNVDPLPFLCGALDWELQCAHAHSKVCIKLPQATEMILGPPALSHLKGGRQHDEQHGRQGGGGGWVGGMGEGNWAKLMQRDSYVCVNPCK